MNAFMLRRRLRELLEACLDGAARRPALLEAAREACDLFDEWEPRSSKMKFLREALAPSVSFFYGASKSLRRAHVAIPIGAKL